MATPAAERRISSPPPEIRQFSTVSLAILAEVAGVPFSPEEGLMGIRNKSGWQVTVSSGPSGWVIKNTGQGLKKIFNGLHE